jgi:hypothetical protein
MIFRLKSRISHYKICVVCYEFNSEQPSTNDIHPLRDGTEKAEGFPR